MLASTTTTEYPPAARLAVFMLWLSPNLVQVIMNHTCRYPVNSTDGPALESDTHASRGCCSTTKYSMGGYIVLYEGVFHGVKHTLPFPGRFKKRAIGALDSFDV